MRCSLGVLAGRSLHCRGGLSPSGGVLSCAAVKEEGGARSAVETVRCTGREGSMLNFSAGARVVAAAAAVLAGSSAGIARADTITVTHWGAAFYGAPYAVAMDK